MIPIPECDRARASHVVLFHDGWMNVGVASYHPDEFSAHRRKGEINKRRNREAATVTPLSEVPDEVIDRMLDEDENIGWAF